MKPKVYLLCGVPASGKSWVADQVKDKFTYIPHDKYTRHELLLRAISEINKNEKNVLIDCPFDERTLRTELESYGIEVLPIFIVESPDLIYSRYMKREGKPPAQNVLTRALSIRHKIEEWSAASGTSEEILKYLKDV